MAAAPEQEASSYLPFEISGSYLEACNCEAICPCRKIGGVIGGRSTYGICFGALSWLIESGHAGEVDLAGLGVVLALRYSDDEPGSPWTFVLYVDERGDQRQREALEQIYLGRLGGSALDHFPWAWKESTLLAVKPARIELDHTPKRGWFRVGEEVTLRVARPVEQETTVSCVISGHDHQGTELYADLLDFEVPGFLSEELSGKCAFQAPFAYSSAG